MKLHKRILALLSAFVIMFSIWSPGVCATDLSSAKTATFWDQYLLLGANVCEQIPWIGQLISQWYKGTLSGLCPNSEDGYHHAETVDSADSSYFYATCVHCGDSFKVSPDDLSAAYSSYVSTLPSSGVTSSGLPVYYPSGWYMVDSTYDFLNSYLQPKLGGFVIECIAPKNGSSVNFFVSSKFSLPTGSYTVTLKNGGRCPSLYMRRYTSDTAYSDYLHMKYPGTSGALSFSSSYEYQFFVNGDTYFSAGDNLYYSLEIVVECLSLDVGVYTAPDANTRPTSISGNYGIIGDDGQLTSVGTQTIVNEGSSTYYNPVTSTTYDLSGWTYDYSTRTYDLSTTSGDTITVEYADESVNITEGDTVYNVYYVVEQEPVDPSTCEHTYTCEHTTLPSCTQAGLDTYTCSLCGDTYTQTVAAAGHTWTVKQSVNTQYDETGALVTEGYTIYECSICGEQYKSTDGTAPPNSSGSSSGGTIGGLLESLIGGLGSIVGGLISGLLSLLTKAVEALGGIGDLLSALWSSLGSIFEGFTGFLAVVFPFLPEEFLTILEFGFILLVGAGIIKKFSS